MPPRRSARTKNPSEPNLDDDAAAEHIHGPTTTLKAGSKRKLAVNPELDNEQQHEACGPSTSPAKGSKARKLKKPKLIAEVSGLTSTEDNVALNPDISKSPGEDIPGPPAAPLKKKRGRPPKSQTAPTPPSQLENGGNVAAATKPDGAKSKHPKALGPAVVRDALPYRESRIAAADTLAAHYAPQARRSSQEVAAARENERKELDDLIRRGEEAKLRVAQMHIAEEEQDCNAWNPTRLSASLAWNRQPQPSTTQATILDSEDDDASGAKPSSGEEFNFMEVDEMPSESSDSQSDGEKMITKSGKQRAIPKKKKKVEKGQTKNDIAVMAEKLRGKSQASGSNLKTIFQPSDTAPKKYANAGLKKNTAQKEKRPKEPDVIDPYQVGGLQDSDAVATQPKRPPQSLLPGLSRTQIPEALYSKSLQRNDARRNQLVGLVATQSSVDPTYFQSSDGNTTERSRPKKSKLKKVNTKANTNFSSDDGSHDLTKEFLDDPRWPKVFIPTLTHALYVSQAPFSNFTMESPEFLVIVQRVFDLAFPTIDFTLSPNNAIVKTSYERMKTRRSKIAGAIRDYIKDFLSQAPYANQPRAIRDYVHWALRPDGPAYYQAPTPENCIAPRGSSAYIAPEGFLQSEFIAPIAEKYLKYALNSVLHPTIGMQNPPKGLYVLILTAVERAFRAHITGAYTDPPVFGHQNYWSAMQDFYKILDLVSENRWKTILKFDAQDESLWQDNHADNSMISANRLQLYIPSSP